MSLSVGIDWGEDHYDVAVMDRDGTVLAIRQIDTGLEGFTTILRLVSEHGGSPEITPVGIETDTTLIVTSLRRAGFTVYPLNPSSCRALPRAPCPVRPHVRPPRCRADRRCSARGSTHLNRPLPTTNNDALALKALARQHQETIWAWHDMLNRLRSLLLEFYPQAVATFPNLKHKAALEVLHAAPTLAKATTLTRRRVVALLHRCDRRNDPALVDHILTTLRADSLRQPEAVEQALGPAVVQPAQTRRHGRWPRRPGNGTHASLPGTPHSDAGQKRPWTGSCSCSTRTRRDRRRPAPIPHHRQPSLLPRHDTSDTSLGPAMPRHARSPTSNSPTPATGGPCPCSPSQLTRKPTTTLAARPETTTTQLHPTWPTSCSENRCSAFTPTSPGTKQQLRRPPRPTSPPQPDPRLLDI